MEVAGFDHASRHGGSGSLVLRAADGRLVLVKFKANPQSTRALVGDLVGTRLGCAVGAAFPEPVLVHVPLERLRDIVALRCQPWSPGLQFGSVFHSGAAPVVSQAAARRLVDLDRLPVTALVELWLYNEDLKPSHLMESGGRLLVVDHGHVFPGGPRWSRDSLRWGAGRLPSVSSLAWLARASGRRFDFGPAVRSCEAVGDEDLRRLIREVPKEWGLDPGRASALHDFLCGRRRRLARWAEDMAARWNVGR